MEKNPRLDTDYTPNLVRSVRDVPPAHYVLKIESFSLLSNLLEKSGDDKYESNEFEAGGYKWKLLLYPNGKKKRDAKDHISLYLEILDAKNLPIGSGVNVVFKFFVFDQIREKYLTIEDVSSFNALTKERGIPRLLSLTTLYDPSNGYLIDDCCIFGAEVFVVKCQRKGESLIMKNVPDSVSLTWTIDNFSELKDDFLYSEGFPVGGFQWKLGLHPNRTSKEEAKGLSLYLHIHEDNSILHTGWKVYAEHKLIIEDQVNGKHHEKTGKNWFSSSTFKAWGFSNFMTHHDLKDERKGFLVNDNLVVEGEITILSVVNRFA